MIKVNETFEFDRDAYGWTLVVWRDGINPKTKEPTRTSKQYHYPKLSQVCNEILDQTQGQAESVQDIVMLTVMTKDELKAAIEGISHE